MLGFFHFLWYNDLGDARCWNAEKWNEESSKSWTPKVWCRMGIFCAKSMQRWTSIRYTIWWNHCTVQTMAGPVWILLCCLRWYSFSICMVWVLCAGLRKKCLSMWHTVGFWDIVYRKILPTSLPLAITSVIALLPKLSIRFSTGSSWRWWKQVMWLPVHTLYFQQEHQTCTPLFHYELFQPILLQQ